MVEAIDVLVPADSPGTLMNNGTCMLSSVTTISWRIFLIVFLSSPLCVGPDNHDQKSKISETHRTCRAL